MGLWRNQVDILKNEEIQNLIGILLLVSKTQTGHKLGNWALEAEHRPWPTPCESNGNLSPTTARN